MPRKTSPALAAALPAQKLIGLLLVTLVAACVSLEAWPVECGSSDCSRSVPFNVSLADPYVTRRMPVVQNSMPLAYSVVTDSAGRAFVGSLDGSFTCISLASGAVQWRVALGFGPLSSAAAVCVPVPTNALLVWCVKCHACFRYSAPAGSQGVLVMGRSGDVALLGLMRSISTAFLYCLTSHHAALARGQLCGAYLSRFQQTPPQSSRVPPPPPTLHNYRRLCASDSIHRNIRVHWIA
jgi:hypothetical protein